VIEKVKTATKNDVADEDMVITLFADYCQNMEMPFFGKDQPGETYYYNRYTVTATAKSMVAREETMLHRS
jgi:hypothetical protein